MKSLQILSSFLKSNKAPLTPNFLISNEKSCHWLHLVKWHWLVGIDRGYWPAALQEIQPFWRGNSLYRKNNQTHELECHGEKILSTMANDKRFFICRRPWALYYHGLIQRITLFFNVTKKRGEWARSLSRVQVTSAEANVKRDHHEFGGPFFQVIKWYSESY